MLLNKFMMERVLLQKLSYYLRNRCYFRLICFNSLWKGCRLACRRFNRIDYQRNRTLRKTLQKHEHLRNKILRACFYSRSRMTIFRSLMPHHLKGSCSWECCYYLVYRVLHLIINSKTRSFQLFIFFIAIRFVNYFCSKTCSGTACSSSL